MVDLDEVVIGSTVRDDRLGKVFPTFPPRTSPDLSPIDLRHLSRCSLSVLVFRFSFCFTCFSVASFFLSWIVMTSERFAAMPISISTSGKQLPGVLLLIVVNVGSVSFVDSSEICSSILFLFLLLLLLFTTVVWLLIPSVTLLVLVCLLVLDNTVYLVLSCCSNNNCFFNSLTCNSTDSRADLSSTYIRSDSILFASSSLFFACKSLLSV